jgi:hypothetical protein
MGVPETTWACFDDMSLSTGKWTCLQQHELIWRKAGLPTAISPHPGQTSLSKAKRGYLSQIKLIHARITLSFGKSGCLAQDGLV